MTHLKRKFTNECVVAPDGTRIGYRKTGNGPGLILLHGGLQSSLNFTEFAGTLPAEGRIELENSGHLTADNSEQPLKVGQALLDFFKN